MTTITGSARSGRRRGGELHAILFADLCGFTEYTYAHGDEMGAGLALAFHEHARGLARREGCSMVKSIGDAVMVHSTHCGRALRLAQGLLSWSEGDGHPAVRMGLDAGPAIGHNGDWYGCTVNTAARIAEAAMPGEIVLTERVLAVLPWATRLQTVGLGVRSLKGLPEMSLHAACAGAFAEARGVPVSV
jgi:adenylate cyclase